MSVLKSKKVILSFLAALLFVGMAGAVAAFAQDLGFEQAQNIGEGAFGTADIRDVIVNVVNIALGFLGIVAVIIIIYGGFVWMTAAGNPERIDKARRILIGAVIGLAIILASWAIALFVIRQFSGATGGNLCTTPGEVRDCSIGSCPGTRICTSAGVFGSCIKQDPSCGTGGPGPGGNTFRVTGQYPNGDVNAALCTFIWASFNGTVDESTVASNFNVYQCIGTDPADPCASRSSPILGSPTSLDSAGNPTNVVEFKSAVDLGVNATYLVEVTSSSVTGGLTSIDGVSLASGDYSWTFTTGNVGDATPPTVVLPTDPADGDTNICLAKTIRVDFSEPMRRMSLLDPNGLTVTSDNGGTVPAYRRGVSGGNDSLWVDPLTPYDAEKRYMPLINAGVVQDACGNFLDGNGDGTPGDNYSWSFDTGTTPRCKPLVTDITGTGLYDTDTAPPDANIVTISGNDFGTSGAITFSDAVDALSGPACLEAQSPYLTNASCFDSWSPIEARVYLPAVGGSSNGAVSGDVRLTSISGETSNLVPFTVIAPHIDSIVTGRIDQGLPAAGVKQFMTLWGSNFGTGDEVWLTKVSQPDRQVRAEVVCGAGGWKDNQIIIAPPETLDAAGGDAGEWYVQVWKNDGGSIRRSNLGTFLLDAESAGPGLCAITPVSGPFDTPFSLTGENFESLVSGNESVQFGRPGSGIPSGGSVSVTLSAPPNPDTADGMLVPNIEQGNGIGVFITDGTLTSNSVLFDVTETGNLPIIFQFDPVAGGAGQYVTITGSNFGRTAGMVYLASALSNPTEYTSVFQPLLFPSVCQEGLWSDSQIVFKIPPNFAGGAFGDYFLFIERGSDGARGNSSNLDNPTFSYNSNAPTPGICKVEPANGIAGTPVSIYGDNYGGSQGGSEVRFFNSVSATVNNWQSQQIDTTVPAGAESGPLVVRVSEDSNPFYFSVGLCTDAADPASICAPGTTCCASGDFAGQCRTDLFPGTSSCDGVAQQCVQSWTFTSGVGIGESCDADTTTPLPMCEPDNSKCNASNLVCNISSCTCEEFGVVYNDCNGINQSPSPANAQDDACINSAMNVRFNDSLDAITVTNATVLLKKCGQDIHCLSPSPVPINAPNLHKSTVPDDTIYFEPSSNLEPDTWYRVTIDGVTSTSGIPLKEPYWWQFKTKNSTAPCAPNQCRIVPPEQTVISINNPATNSADYNLTSSFLCNLLIGTYTYDVSVDPASVALVPPVVTSGDSFTATAQERGSTVIRAINQNDPSISCTAAFTVDVQKPKVTDKFPDCLSACTNALLGAKFTIPVAESGLRTTGVSPTITVRECTTVDCSTMSDPLTLTAPTFDTIEPLDYTSFVTFDTTSLLKLGTTYSVTLQADSIMGEGGETLTPNQGNVYTWTFTTKAEGSGLCEVDHMTLEPAEATVKAVGVAQDFAGQAYGPPDECNPRSGQRLVSTGYSWTDNQSPDYGWLTGNSDIALILRGTVPPYDPTTNLLDRDGDGKVDPVQSAEAQGLTNCDPSCSTEVIGTIDPNKTGEQPIRCNAGGLNECANITLTCGYQTDSQCAGLPGLGVGYGVADSSCCAPRPNVLASMPQEGELAICRNAVAEVTFDRELDAKSLPGNVILAENVGLGTCPIGTQSLLVRNGSATRIVKALPSSPFERLALFFKELWERLFVRQADAAYVVGDNLCIVPSAVRLASDLTTITIEPTTLLSSLKNYTIVIIGDDDITDGNKVGVRSRDGVTFNGPVALTRGGRTFNSEIVSFSTGEDICDIAQITHTFKKGPLVGGVPQESSTARTDRFFCVRDDCKDDVAGDSGNQHLLEVVARDREGRAFAADISYTEAGPDFFGVSPATSPSTFVTVDDSFPGFARDVRGTITVFAVNPYKAANRVAKTLSIQLFNCANPWPSIDTFPFVDSAASCDTSLSGCPATGFEFYYCRDAGGPGTQDDLPALANDPVVIGTPGEQICYGGPNPTVSCTSDADCGATGKCFVAGLKDLVFTRGGISNVNSPTDLQASLFSGSQQGGAVSLSWNSPSGSVDGYKVYWGLQEGSYPFSMDVGNATSATIRNLNPDTTYYFAVTSYVRSPYGGAESSFSTAVSILPQDTTPPPAPAVVTVQSTSPGSVTVLWQVCAAGQTCAAENDIAGFRLYIGTSSGNYQEVRDVGNVHSYTLNLASGATYYFVIESYDRAGNPPEGSPGTYGTAEASVTVL